MNVSLIEHAGVATASSRVSLGSEATQAGSIAREELAGATEDAAAAGGGEGGTLVVAVCASGFEHDAAITRAEAPSTRAALRAEGDDAVRGGDSGRSAS